MPALLLQAQAQPPDHPEATPPPTATMRVPVAQEEGRKYTLLNCRRQEDAKHIVLALQ
jgi:hypothetical protein